ncbi:acyl-CoA dehydrogenase [Fictibacillus sp. NRS-1165]|uniref:acyl-CoA dehydrogenase n=1 Tax=Fictibacillus sp. NRS-1165 TaxID=3144463 RepID=UPI003D20BB99
MNLTFTEEQLMMQKMVRDFAQKEIAPIVDKMDETDQFPAEAVKKMGELGLMGIPIPEKYGGAGMDFTSYIIAINELSKVSATVGVILSVHTSLVANSIYYFGNEEQKQRLIPKLAGGDYLGAFGLTEPGAGSDAAALKTKAVKKGDKYILNGSKIFITNAGAAHLYIVFASTHPEAGPKGIAAFIVEKGTPGFSVGKKEKKMGLNGSNTCEIIFDQAEVPAENLLGAEGEGFKIAMSNLEAGRIGIAAQSLGIAEAGLQHSLEYAKTRKQFGKPIGAQQGLAFMLSDMATRVEAAKLLTYRAAHMRTMNQPCGKEASMAKLYASQAAMKTAIDAIQVHGGYGYTKEYPVERLFRDAKVCEIYEGTSEIQRVVLSKHLIQD